MENIVNKNKTEQLQTKFKLTDGSFTTDNFVISSKFNDLFVNVGLNLAKKIPHQTLSPLDLMGRLSVNSIYLSKVTSLKVNNILFSSKNGAAGHDEISAALLKLVSSCFVDPLSYLYNISLQQVVSPCELKVANVIPLYKADDTLLVNNYHPVSLLCVISNFLKELCTLV